MHLLYHSNVDRYTWMDYARNCRCPAPTNGDRFRRRETSVACTAVRRVSRQVTRLVAGNVARVRRSTLERLARALGIDADTLLMVGGMPQYKQWVVDDTGYVDFRGFGMPSVQRQPIAEVFVDLAVEEAAGQCQDDCSPGESRARSPEGASGAARAGHKVRPESRPRDLPRRIREVARRPCSVSSPIRRLHGAGRMQRLQSYVRLPELCRAQEVDEHVDLVKFFAARAAERGCPGSEELLRQELADENRRCLVLLDGLDEVGNQEQRERLGSRACRPSWRSTLETGMWSRRGRQVSIRPLGGAKGSPCSAFSSMIRRALSDSRRNGPKCCRVRRTSPAKRCGSD